MWTIKKNNFKFQKAMSEKNMQKKKNPNKM